MWACAGVLSAATGVWHCSCGGAVEGWGAGFAAHLGLQLGPFDHLDGERTKVLFWGAAPSCVGRRPQLKSAEFCESTLDPRGDN